MIHLSSLPKIVRRLRGRLSDMRRKEGPFVEATVRGDLPAFILSADPPEIGEEVPVFCYHLIDETSFRGDLQYLRTNGYVTISASALVAHLRGEHHAPPKSVVLSIDDGHVSIYRHARPLLHEFGMSAVAFVCPGLHRDARTWERMGVAGTDDRPCSWEELREMVAEGILEVESHTFEHRSVLSWPQPLGSLGGPPELVSRLLGGPAASVSDDLRRARRVLNEELGVEALHLALPQHEGTEQTVQDARECGYESCWWGILTYRSRNRPGDSPFYIARYHAKFLRRLPGAERISLVKAILEASSLRALRTASRAV